MHKQNWTQLPLDIAGLAEKRKRMKDRRKSPSSKATSPTRTSSKTTAAGSTSTGKGLEPYWNACCEVINAGLLLPIGIDSPGSAGKLYTPWSNKTVAKSWFSTKLFAAPKRGLLPLASQFSLSFAADGPDTGATVIKSKKIEGFPTVEQKAILRRWFGTSRYTYNQSVSLLEQKETPTSFKKLVPVVFDKLPEWHEETPRQIKVGAVMDACQAVRNAKVKCKKTGEYQKVKCVPYVEKRTPRQPSGRIVALDPGVRDFMTFFSEESFGWLGQ